MLMCGVRFRCPTMHDIRLTCLLDIICDVLKSHGLRILRVVHGEQLRATDAALDVMTNIDSRYMNSIDEEFWGWCPNDEIPSFTRGNIESLALQKPLENKRELTIVKEPEY